ncbi:MAG: protease modulator HflK [Gemmataceae bacterium]
MSRFGVRVFLLLAALAYLSTGIATIRPNERGVVRRFGKIVAHPGPGLWIGLPWGIDRLDRLSVNTVQQLTIDGNESETNSTEWFLTGDQNLVTVRLIVEYSIEAQDASLDRYTIEQNLIPTLLARETEALAREWIAAQPVDELLLKGRIALANDLAERLPRRLEPYRLGIVLQRVNLESISPPSEVQDAFVQVNRAQSEMQTKANEARQTAERRLSEATTNEFRLKTQSESYRNEQLALAQADAASFRIRREQVRNLSETNPHFRETVWWDEMGRLLAGMKNRGRIDLLDSFLGPNGLDISQFIPQKK